MTEFIIAMIVDLLAFGSLALAAVLLHRKNVIRPEQIEVYAYQFFALRDRAIRLVMDGTLEETDPRWQSLYRSLNDAARTASVAKMTNGLRFVMSILKRLEPPDEKMLKEFRDIPEPVRNLWIEYVQAVLTTCLKGNVVLRVIVFLGQKLSSVKRWLETHRPVETKHYRQWQHSADKMHRMAATSC